MGRNLGDLQARLHNKAAQGVNDPLKIAVLVCHDTSIAGMLSSLDVFDNR
jgi:acid phosphatase